MHASDERETRKIAKKIAKSIKNRNVTICLNGDLGAGKTTFTRFLINSLQNKKKNDEIPSPTFTLLQTYEYDYGLIHHYDFYRLDRVQELTELNFSESLNDNICVIEWANKFKKALPSDRIEIDIEILSKESRRVEINFFGNLKKDIFKWL